MREDSVFIAAGISTALQLSYQEAVEKYRDRSDLLGIDIGYKYTGGQPALDNEGNSVVAVRFHVPNKILDKKELKERLLPPSVAGNPTDVLESTFEDPNAKERKIQRTEFFSTIRPGCSVSHQNRGHGTLGAFVRTTSGDLGILSNWHVLSLPARNRSTMRNPPPGSATDVFQPGGSTTATHVIGQYRAALGIVDEDGDFAMVLYNDSRPTCSAQLQSDVHPEAARTARLGEILEKSGVATEVTRARVDGVGTYWYRFQFLPERLRLRGFRLVPLDEENCEISAPGDSGSLWYSDPKEGDPQGVGLHFDGETPAGGPCRDEYAIAFHLPRILRRLGVSLA